MQPPSQPAQANLIPKNLSKDEKKRQSIAFLEALSRESDQPLGRKESVERFKACSHTKTSVPTIKKWFDTYRDDLPRYYSLDSNFLAKLVFFSQDKSGCLIVDKVIAVAYQLDVRFYYKLYQRNSRNTGELFGREQELDQPGQIFGKQRSKHRR
ncbi:hypothetical protein CAEBREN_08040 [Caenorhabditis brenneri]|uniref:Uncharacterized protein n=1 Tax=Caenorhabditis brenneri TaxID=135651 RepID=G0NNT8_CAEBE|nr:hypothetical protein CAEBREN_08040 [Caenorhabditis brenneri]